MTQWNSTASAAARNLGRNSIFCGLTALLPLIVGPITAEYRGFVPQFGWLLMLVFCVIVLALAIHLLFDALLFRLAASHETETAGLAAVDDLLSRMRLRKPDGTPSGLERRIAGSRRIVWRQRFALAICLVIFAILVLDATDGQPLC
ncbi:putative membrane protein [Rhizobium sp. BK226]|jgi:hypothetical protein|uniref:Uncharacterized protein n=1 Tax=Rhizobium anhuiense TaxID=1184720 RepID=A0A3S0QU43_9HYPH|nr:MULTISPECIES: hypothetical protein [Rhizobium]KZS53920.1 hypothetical protein AS890_17345 [Rhizobium anhuiense bv. trifolii]MBB3296596.1 putative membrane protein [Rhizobium sp. BK112]MBB3365811.1 putative membrane protein [Rhizobium sp. BK077]MBB3740789.1 putative membrane protein [Rhizobium sp. BK591]MBB4111505.1 putative membrane protein [Rhizobium sp. BK226]